MRTLAFGLTAIAAIAAGTPADAQLVLCAPKRGTGRVAVRTACNARNEVQLDPATLGLQGPAGPPGKDGVACWDVNEDGQCDMATEDINGNGSCNAADCRGASGFGIPGPPGPPGGGVTQVNSGAGLQGGPITNTGTLSVNAPTCPGSDKLTWNGSGFFCVPDQVGTGTVSTVNTGAGLQGGPITTTGTVSINAPTCTGTDKLVWNGSAFVCTADQIGTGTVASVGSGVGLTGGPITGAGELSVNAPTCTSTQTLTWNGVAFQCVGNGVTQVNGGAGLTGGPITTTGTLAINAPTCTGTDKLVWNGSAFLCTPDQVGSGTVTSVGSGAGLTGGPITGSGALSVNAPTCANTEALSWNGTAFECVATSPLQAVWQHQQAGQTLFPVDNQWVDMPGTGSTVSINLSRSSTCLAIFTGDLEVPTTGDAQLGELRMQVDGSDLGEGYQYRSGQFTSNQNERFGVSIANLSDELSPGTHTFKMQWRGNPGGVGGPTYVHSNTRTFVVAPLAPSP